jgi:hypothetical protein
LGSAVRLALGLAVATLAAWATFPHRAQAARWTLQPTPTAKSAHGGLNAVSCTSSNVCTAVGFSSHGKSEVSRPLVERWTGFGWRIQATPVSAERGALYGVSCTSWDRCVAVGALETADGSTLPLAGRWNGITWSIQKVPRPLDGGSPDDATLYGVSCASASDCFAVGSDDDAGRPLIERWNGSKWSIRRAPNPSADGAELSAVSCPARAHCTAVGAFTPDGSDCASPLVEHWNGTRWAVQPTGRLPTCGRPNDSAFEGVACPSLSACVAVGALSRSSSAYDLTLAEGRHGNTWRIQPTPNVKYLVDPWGGDGTLNDVACTSKTACVAVGYGGSEIHVLPLVERWNGRTWRLQANPANLHDGVLLGISCTSSTKCVAVGVNYAGGADAPVALVERLA